MSKFRCHISVSRDGFVAGPNQSMENPLGEGGERLHDWAIKLAALARVAREARRRGEREHAGHGGDDRERRRRSDGPQHVRAPGGGDWGDGE